MKPNDFFLVNVFTGPGARGNQTCVLLLDDLSDDGRLQRIASDFNLPATTFLQERKGGGFDVRWLAPAGEIDLCGHGAMGATWVLTQLQTSTADKVTYHYRGGVITGRRKGAGVEAGFDRIPIRKETIPDHVIRGFRSRPEAYYTSGNKHLVVFEDPNTVRNMQPDWDALRESETFAYAITAPGEDCDCVSRVMLPYVPFLEDQTTGSAHVVLTEYWTQRLGKHRLHARQASARGGEMECLMGDDAVTLKAQCQLFGRGRFSAEEASSHTIS